MGILVTVFMLLGLLLVSPWPWLSLRGLRARPALVAAIGAGVLVAGGWNTLWHGLRHLDSFWGLAALISGLLMMAVAIIALVEHGKPALLASRPMLGIYALIKPWARLVTAGLLGCFLLYAIALLRLNLGYSVIGY